MTPKILDEMEDSRLPVTLLCGFLGAGKTTLMKHILETKHSETNEGFRCAVIVNDMASLNIDKALIDQSAIVQTDEVIAMQNGCFCCTLQSDLVEQIKELCGKNLFDYMLIEASGVSEPSQIAPLFDLCDDEHDHEEEHTEGPQLGEVARLDTCVTVVDAAEFHSNLGSMKQYENGEMQGTIAELMMEQVEYSNVIILNKQDLVSETQQQVILDRLDVLNPKANVIKSTHGKIDVMEILNTRRFTPEDVGVDSVMLAATRVGPEAMEEVEPSCCVKSVSAGGTKCCRKKKNLFDSGLSQVLLGVVDSKQKQLTRHENRFGITSFVYRSRRPFHPGRIHDLLMDPFFMCSETKEHDLDVLQKKASTKQEKRVEVMGELLRSKGFMWIASTHWVMGGWQQAGNILRVSAEGPWMADARELWEGTPCESEVLKDMTQENGEEFPHGDRRQELVFIGVGLKHENIQNVLDECLLKDDEMKMHPLKWEQTMMEEDRIRLTLYDPPSLVPGQELEEFWGITLSEELQDFTWFPPDDVEEEEEEEGEEGEPQGGPLEHQLRLTQVCLGRGPVEGERNLIEVTVKESGRKITTSIASLRTGPVESLSLNLVFSDPVQFSLVEGTGPVCLSGIRVTQMPEQPGEEEWEDVADMMDEDIMAKFKDKLSLKDDESKKGKGSKKSRTVQQG